MSLGDFQSMDELRASLKEGLQKEKETKEKVVESKNYLTEPESQPRFSKENSP